MRSGSFLGIVLSITVMAGVSHFQSHEAPAPGDAPLISKPLLLEKNEGELRTRRPRPKPVPATQFLLKVDPKSNGSRHLVVGTEDIAPEPSFRPTNTPAKMKFCRFTPAPLAYHWGTSSAIRMLVDSFSFRPTRGLGLRTSLPSP